MDDLRAGWFPHNVILRVLDSVKMSVPAHGALVPFYGNTFYITTNCEPKELYKEDPAGALARRVSDYATVYKKIKGKDLILESEPQYKQ